MLILRLKIEMEQEMHLKGAFQQTKHRIIHLSQIKLDKGLVKQIMKMLPKCVKVPEAFLAKLDSKMLEARIDNLIGMSSKKTNKDKLMMLMVLH